MATAGCEGENLAVGVSAAHGVIADGPLNIPNSEGSEGSPGLSSDVRVVDISHRPGVLREVVGDDGPLHPDIRYDGVRRVLDGVLSIKE